ncbi:MFS transporter [Enterococcus sp. BWR-S5]|uniref:MFS transporter n=1 Tax=Enterococcus sp. BWR-S5 TaxID=2787714 RepID=UPI0019237E6B|nr:MFS transporter [Enterococcus sp. BWR-S5]MBL1224522.1 MFS transporter [Enterococcus sp. BWR-S5]
MMKQKNNLKSFMILWVTQTLSSFGSSMTSFALIIWIYQQQGSALTMGLLTVCSYAPYVLLSMFAGAFSDKWNKKKTMLFCDSVAVLGTLAAFILLQTGQLMVWHLYIINIINGIMGAFQSPASDVAITLLVPKEYFQKTSGLRSFSNALVTMLTPVLATMLLSFFSIQAVLLMDGLTFSMACIALLFFVPIDQSSISSNENSSEKTSVFELIKEGIGFLKENRGILELILFLSAINLIASMSDTALPALVLAKYPNDETVLGLVNGCTGLASLVGSIIVSLRAAPKNRIQVICTALFISMATENFILALTDSIPLWCFSGILGWLPIPFMSANMDVILREKIPLEMQGRVFSVRNALQFFTIPLGHLLAGLSIDEWFEPLMQRQVSPFLSLFGEGKGAGSAFLLFILGIFGILVCLFFSSLKRMQALG